MGVGMIQVTGISIDWSFGGNCTGALASRGLNWFFSWWPVLLATEGLRRQEWERIIEAKNHGDEHRPSTRTSRHTVPFVSLVSREEPSEVFRDSKVILTRENVETAML